MLASELKTIAGMPRAFLDSLGVGIVLLSPQTNHILYANKEFCRFTGYDSELLTDGGLAFPDITHPDDRSESSSKQARMLRGEIDQYRLDKRYITRTGDVVWAHVTASVVRGPDGGVRWFTRVVEDITSRKLLERQLAVAEEIGGLATWRWQVNPERSETSPRYNALFGFTDQAPQPSMEEFISRVHPEDRKSVESNVRRALAGGGFTHEYRMVRSDGEIRWMRGMATVVLGADGVVTELIGATIDITHLKNRSGSEQASEAIHDVVRHMKAHWNEPLAIPDIARKHRVSPRSIHRHFAAIGTTPKNFLKAIRLQRARARLSDGGGGTSVTGVAFECGFANPGHFARDYRRAFGELPSETLRRVS